MKFLLITFFLLISSYANTKNCINYENLESNILSGELKVMSSTIFLDHGDIINHYIFVINKDTCFTTEYGDWDVREVQVILSDEQLQNIEQIANKKIVMEIEDYIVGETSGAIAKVNNKDLVTDKKGKLRGSFFIDAPNVKGNQKFKTGTKLFRLSDTADNSKVVGVSDSNGEAEFTSSGLLQTTQETIISVRNAKVTSEDMKDARTLTSSSVSTETETRWCDPLAQTFLVEDSVLEGGVYLTKIDLFFFTKDAEIPVAMDIRTVENGTPTQDILPLSKVVKDPDDVVIDSSAQTATNFKFESPVYLQGGLEYCIAVIANVPTYKVWIARMGETEVQSTLAQAQVGGTADAAQNVLFSDRTVSEQPEFGVLFKGHNNRTWAPSLTEDLKMNIYRAEFSSLTGTIPLVNDSNPVKTLEKNPLEFLDGSAVIKVFHPDHGMYSTSNNVTIANVKSGITTTLSAAITSSSTTIELASGTNFDDTSGVYSRDASNVYFIKIDDEIISYTSISTNTISSATRGVDSTTAASHDEGATVELYMLHKIPFTQINKTHTAVANVEIDSYTVSSTATAVIDGTSSTRSRNGGTDATATENILYDVAKYQVGLLELPGTSVTAQKRPSTATSPSGSETSFTKTSAADAINVPLNENIYYNVPYLVASDINQDNEMSSVKSLSLDLTLNSTLSNLSPVIDAQRLSMIAVANRINNVDSSSDVYPTSEYFASTEPDGDNNAAIYCTKQIELEQKATALKVLHSANRGSDAEIKVMYKIFREDDETDFNETGWRFFNDNGSPDVSVGASTGINDFREYVYTAGVTDDGIGTELDPFVSFAIKIVMQATNSTSAPRIKDFRAIALAT